MAVVRSVARRGRPPHLRVSLSSDALDFSDGALEMTEVEETAL